HPHLAAIDLGIGVGKAEECAGVGGLDIKDIATAGAAAQVTVERRVAPELGAEREALDLTAAPRHPQVEAAHGLAVEAGNRSEPDVEIDVLRLLLGLIGGGPGQDLFYETAAGGDFAAHHDPPRPRRAPRPPPPVPFPAPPPASR